jgi:Icc-related predicted phosphoesterase
LEGFVIIDCISDPHGHYPELEGGDLLIVAGDLTASDKLVQHYEFGDWLKKQPYKKKVVIAGNHDMRLQELGIIPSDDFFHCSSYLCDSGTEFEGLRIWGTPWTLTFPGINPKCTAFTGNEELLAEKFALIPDDIDILVTHGPPYGVLDRTVRGECVGSKSLQMKLYTSFPNLKLHVFGHIHEAYGVDATRWDDTDYKRINCSHVNELYEPVNKPIRIVL